MNIGCVHSYNKGVYGSNWVVTNSNHWCKYKNIPLLFKKRGCAYAKCRQCI